MAVTGWFNAYNTIFVADTRIIIINAGFLVFFYITLIPIGTAGFNASKSGKTCCFGTIDR